MLSRRQSRFKNNPINWQELKKKVANNEIRAIKLKESRFGDVEVDSEKSLHGNGNMFDTVFFEGRRKKADAENGCFHNLPGYLYKGVDAKYCKFKCFEKMFALSKRACDLAEDGAEAATGKCVVETFTKN